MAEIASCNFQFIFWCFRLENVVKTTSDLPNIMMLFSERARVSIFVAERFSSIRNDLNNFFGQHDCSICN